MTSIGCWTGTRYDIGRLGRYIAGRLAGWLAAIPHTLHVGGYRTGLTSSCTIVTLMQCWHAFIPTIRATLDRQRKYKEVGDVGVEHARGDDVRQAVLRSRPSRSGSATGRVMGVDRKETGPAVDQVETKEGGGRLPFNREMLIELGLVAEMGVRGKDVTRRRELVCAWLGIGACDGKQLLRQLNTYGFMPADLNEALAYATDNL